MKENDLNKVMKRKSNNSGSDKSLSYSLLADFAHVISRLAAESAKNVDSVAPVREGRKERRKQGKKEARKEGKEASRSANI